MSPAAPPIELRTARLVLRRWRDDDREPFAALNADPRVMEHFPALLDRETSNAVIDRIEASFDQDGLGLWALETDGRFIGFTGLFWQHPPLPFAPAVEVGWRLAADAWGYGYATEAAAASLDDGFGRLHLDEIVSMTAIPNTRSQRVMQRLGMHRDPSDDFDHHRLPAGHPLERHVLYRLSRAEWRAAGPPARAAT